MAVITDTFTPAASRTTLLTPADMPRQATAIPRAVLNFGVANGVVSAKPINDQAILNVVISLPTQFAYRMIELTAWLTQDTAPDWGDQIYLEVVNAIRGLEQGLITRHVTAAVDFVAVPTPINAWAVDLRVPSYILQSITRPTSSPTITFKASNNSDPAAAAGVMSFYASFFEYDIEQVQMFPIHYPTLTLERA